MRAGSGTSPVAVAAAQASPTAASTYARAAASCARARAARTWVSPRSARLRRLPVGVLAPASAARSSSAARAIPSATAAIAIASVPNTGNAYSAPASVGRSESSEALRPAGTSRSPTSMSWLPVARSPATCQVSWICTSAAGNSSRRMSGAPLASLRISPFSSIRQPPISQSQCSQPDANDQRPLAR